MSGKRMKRAVSLMLVLLLFILEAPLAGLAANTEGVYTINGKNIRASDASSSSGECWAYANAIYKKIWGVNFNSYFSDSDNFLRDFEDEDLILTAERLEQFVSAAALGSSLRICNQINLHANDGYINGEKPGHNQIIVQKDSEGFTVVQGGLSDSPHRREDYYTWQSFVDTWWLGGTYHYIKYIKWPGAPSLAKLHKIPGSEPTLTDAVYPTGTLLCGQRFLLEGRISSTYPIVQVSAFVTDMNGADALPPYLLRMSSNTYNIGSDGMDSAMTFASLSPGGYTYSVKVKNMLGDEYTVIESFFTVAASKKVNEDTVFNFLINNGFNLAAACGVMANIEQESDFKPDSLYYEVGDYYSHGLIQWNHGRYDRLLAFLADNGYEEYSIEGQLRFMLLELQTVSYYSRAYEAMQNASNTAEGAYDVAYNMCKYYEMPSDTENRSKARGQLAKTYYERYTVAGDVSISFNSRGGTKADQKTVRYAGTYGTLPSPTRSGDVFDGWYTMPEGGTPVRASSTVWVTGQQVLYAHWRHGEYQLNYHIDGETILPLTYTHGYYVELLTNVTNQDFVFAGWYASPDFEGERVYELTEKDYGDKEFYAKWVPFTGFRDEEGGVRYLENGEVVTHAWRTILGNTFYLTEAGYVNHEESLVIDGETYQFEPFIYEGMTLCRLIGIKNGLVWDNGVRLYENDVPLTGWRTIGNDLLYFDPDTALMLGGEQTIDGKDCRFESYQYEDFILWRVIKHGLYEEDGGIRFYENGKMATGWRSFAEEAEELVYFSPDTGLMVTETTEINGVRHSFEPFVYNSFTLYKSVYKKNGFFREGVGTRYYVDGVYVTSWQVIEGSKMFFDLESGNMVTYSCTIGGEWYDFETFSYDSFLLSRVKQNGFIKSINDGIRYYRNSVYVTGWQTIDGYMMYFSDDGIMADGDTVIDALCYAFEPFEQGDMTLFYCTGPKNGFVSEPEGIKYYVDGCFVRDGWQDTDVGRMYFAGETMVEGPVVTIDEEGKNYCFESFEYFELTLWRSIGLCQGLFAQDGGIRYFEDGVPAKGWRTINGLTMYFDPENALMIDRCSAVIDGEEKSFKPFVSNGMILFASDLKTGDLNGDGTLTIDDVTALLNILATFSAETAASFDLDNDDALQISDLTRLLNMLAG